MARIALATARIFLVDGSAEGISEGVVVGEDSFSRISSAHCGREDSFNGEKTG